MCVLGTWAHGCINAPWRSRKKKLCCVLLRGDKQKTVTSARSFSGRRASERWELLLHSDEADEAKGKEEEAEEEAEEEGSSQMSTMRKPTRSSLWPLSALKWPSLFSHQLHH